jgi:hypothetical protein
MISETPFTKEEFERFMVAVRERAEQRRQNRHFAITCAVFTGIMVAFCIGMAFVS